MRENQILICIDREFGSGGRDISHILGDYFHIPVYHHSLLRKVGIHEDYDLDLLRAAYDEHPEKIGLSRRVRGFSNSNAEYINQKEFEILKEMAKNGQSFIVIGHCGETILKEFGVISIFVCGEKSMKMERTMGSFHEDEKKAKKRMKTMDKTRKTYHNHYFPKHKWGDSRYYDLCINSTPLGIEGTAKILERYIEARIHKDQQEQAD